LLGHTTLYPYRLDKLTHCTLGCRKTILYGSPCRMHSLPCQTADEQTQEQAALARLLDALLLPASLPSCDGGRSASPRSKWSSVALRHSFLLSPDPSRCFFHPLLCFPFFLRSLSSAACSATVELSKPSMQITSRFMYAVRLPPFQKAAAPYSSRFHETDSRIRVGRSPLLEGGCESPRTSRQGPRTHIRS
jgi:hypothetical protein